MRIHRLYLTALPFMALLVAGCTEWELPTEPTEAALHIGESTNFAVFDDDALTSISALIDEVIVLEGAGVLNRGQARALRNHLANAQRHIQAGRVAPAHAQLLAFQEQVSNFVANEVLTAAQAMRLLERIRRLLEPPTTVECLVTDVEQLLWESWKDEEARPWLRVDFGVAEPIYVNEPVFAYARLTEEGRPILDAYVQADMHTPDGDCLAVQLLDDGWGIDENASDGVYSAVLPSPPVSGTYTFLISATGMDESDTPFSRAEALVRFARIRVDAGFE